MLEEEKNKLDECTQDRNIEASSEDRNCKENSCCEKKYAPNIPMYHFEFTNTGAEEDASCEEKMDSRREMIKKIRCLDFAIVELAQYLDTHPEDKKALALHKEYANAEPTKLVIERHRIYTENSNKPYINGIINLDNLVTHPKNPNITRFFKEIGRVEELGSGIEKIIQYCEAYTGTIPVIKDENLFTFEIFKYCNELISTNDEHL